MFFYATTVFNELNEDEWEVWEVQSALIVEW